MNDEFLNEQINNIESTQSIMINVKIRTLDNEFMVNVNAENKVEELKKSIETGKYLLIQVSNVPTDRQRLIFRGRLLKDSDSISHYKISDLDVVHLVAKTGEQQNSNSEESAMNTESNTQRRRSDSIFSLMNRIIRGEPDSNEAQGTTINTASNIPRGIPGILSRRSRRAMREDANNRNSDFNSIECKESIYQNFATIKNMVESSSISNLERNFKESNNEKLTESTSNTISITQEPVDRNNINNITASPEQTELFLFKNRKLIKGQWVDVKDTIEQWLEAQVLDLKENKVYIHYNGWGTRWDEWIDMDSDRIRPFRFHTHQTTYSNYLSPFPSVKPDANVSLESNIPQQETFFDIFEEIERNYSVTQDMMKYILSRRGEKSESSQREVFLMSKRISPFLDRLGRTMTDVGAYINHSMRSGKLEELDKKMFDSQNLDSSLKPYDANEARLVEAEENARRSTRESGMNSIYPVNKFDRTITNQMPLVDSSLQIHNQRQINNTPLVDIYVHTYITPLRERNSANNTANNISSPNNLQNGSRIFPTENNNLNLTSNDIRPNGRPSHLINNPFMPAELRNGNYLRPNNSADGSNVEPNNTTNQSSFDNLISNIFQRNFTNNIPVANNSQIFPNNQVQTNTSNITLASDSNENLLGNKRESDNSLQYKERESVENIPNDNVSQNQGGSSQIPDNGQTNPNHNPNSNSEYDIIVEEFYENEEDNVGEEEDDI